MYCTLRTYRVRPVSGSRILRMTLCLASYSSFVIGRLVERRAFCSSVIAAGGEERRHGSWFLVLAIVSPESLYRCDAKTASYRVQDNNTAMSNCTFMQCQYIRNIFSTDASLEFCTRECTSYLVATYTLHDYFRFCKVILQSPLKMVIRCFTRMIQRLHYCSEKAHLRKI